MSKRNSVTLLFAVLIATVVLFTHTTASARVCLFRIGGTCIFWSGSVIGELTATKNVDELEGASYGFTLDNMRGGIVYCRDKEKGTVKPVKKNMVFNFNLAASERIRKGDFIQCGSAEIVNVAPVARLNDNDFNILDKICGPNSEAISFVPIFFRAKITLKDPKYGDETVAMQCRLPEPASWDRENKRPEKIQYNCDDEK